MNSTLTPPPTPAPADPSPAARLAPPTHRAASPANNYLRAKVMTATPEQLQMMLYDGAVRFAEQGRAAIERRDREAAYTALGKSQKIILELQGSLKRSVNPELCDKLIGLYNFIYLRLVDAGMRHEVGPADEALRILRYQRETWALLLDQLSKQKAGAAAMKMAFPDPSGKMEGQMRLSLSA